MRFFFSIFACLVLVSGTGCQQQTSIVVASATDVSTLDPFAMFSRVEVSLADHIVQTLTFLDRDMKVVPLLATEWKRLEGDLTWELALRKNVAFHNGEPFDARAVKFSGTTPSVCS